MTRRPFTSTVAALALAAGLAGCSADTNPPAAATASATAAPVPATPATTITATNFDFGPPITVSPGATVTFVNTDETRHNVTADDKSFASPTVLSATTTFTAPAKPGNYPFHCTFHPVMHGTLIVK